MVGRVCNAILLWMVALIVDERERAIQLPYIVCPAACAPGWLADPSVVRWPPNDYLLTPLMNILIVPQYIHSVVLLFTTFMQDQDQP